MIFEEKFQNCMYLEDLGKLLKDMQNELQEPGTGFLKK